jgi:hypothetical protein
MALHLALNGRQNPRAIDTCRTFDAHSVVTVTNMPWSGANEPSLPSDWNAKRLSIQDSDSRPLARLKKNFAIGLPRTQQRQPHRLRAALSPSHSIHLLSGSAAEKGQAERLSKSRHSVNGGRWLPKNGLTDFYVNS